jgi:hypothetical protein
VVDIHSGILFANIGGYFSTSNSLLNSVIGGTVAGSGFGQLQVSGTVNLNGVFSVTLANGYLPGTNDTFAVLTAGARSGVFASFSISIELRHNAVEQHHQLPDRPRHWRLRPSASAGPLVAAASRLEPRAHLVCCLEPDPTGWSSIRT